MGTSRSNLNLDEKIELAEYMRAFLMPVGEAFTSRKKGGFCSYKDAAHSDDFIAEKYTARKITKANVVSVREVWFGDLFRPAKAATDVAAIESLKAEIAELTGKHLALVANFNIVLERLEDQNAGQKYKHLKVVGPYGDLT